MITHPHGDHIDEMIVLRDLGFKVRQFWRPKSLPPEEVYKQNQASYTHKLDAYYEMSDTYSSKIADSELVGNPDVSGGVSIKKFRSANCGVSNINNHSGVVVFEYLGLTVVIPGDNEPPSWRALMQQPQFASAMAGADIFMASHHGRESGYCADIFESKPRLCVVSDGKVRDTDARNRYSHHATGWQVNRRDNAEKQDRLCVTTRSDGYIDIKIGSNSDGGRYLSVSVD